MGLDGVNGLTSVESFLASMAGIATVFFLVSICACIDIEKNSETKHKT
jgi:hypothetical protein